MVSRLSAGVSGGRIVGSRLASSVLPVPGGPIIRTLWLPGRGDQEGPLGVVLALDVDEVVLRVRELAEDLVEVDGLGLDVELSGEEADGLGEAADGDRR